jgi:subtilisin family serine protease
VGSLSYTNNQETMSDFTVPALSKSDPYICAPGAAVRVASVKGKYDLEEGTSFAAPIIVGALALLMEYYPKWQDTPEKYIDLILKSARKKALGKREDKLSPDCGAGAIDIVTALHALSN